ncbi:alpha/beta hydrolase family protein [Paucibacter sp. Y2R2-4]|uniref:alpha/beta hydrolase family protein n=1 Tax=Paucibacter sp. Y2R2-4 TaxID=2893553 RepID=UPI0021E466B4|nr:esterase FrsA [Paucibacter sp. Y2R2-4]MCV2351187.1 esterase FrsA [Paucibacter sp. Y2R2-4]
MRRRVFWLGLAALCLGLLLVLALRLAAHEVKAQQQLDLSFSQGDYQLSGSLLLPSGPGPHPVVLFVHGDGPQDRGLDRYALLMNAFLKAGIACFSWDKPGTGRSLPLRKSREDLGWQGQTLQQRAEEAAAAMALLAKRPEVDPRGLGLIGFSQGAWVLAEAAQWPQPQMPAFLITVGGAVDWASQGEYFTRQRLRREGLGDDEAAVEAVLAWQRAAPQPDLALSYADYRQALTRYLSASPPPLGANATPLSAERYRFVALNRQADASAGVHVAQAPFLAVWGAQDLNVDAAASARRYAQLLHAGPIDQSNQVLVQQHHAVKVFAGGDHQLLRADRYQTQRPEEWTWGMSARYLWDAEAAYAPGYLQLLPDWTLAQLRRR